MAGYGDGKLLVIGRHGVWLGEIETEELFEAGDGSVAIFGDDGMAVKIGDEELFEASIFRGNGFAEAGETLRIVADFFHGMDTGA